MGEKKLAAKNKRMKQSGRAFYQCMFLAWALVAALNLGLLLYRDILGPHLFQRQQPSAGSVQQAHEFSAICCDIVTALKEEDVAATKATHKTSSSPCTPPSLGLDWIHLPISATSRNLKDIRRVGDLPLLKYLLRSLALTAEPHRFRYDIGIGADQGDAWLDNAAHILAIITWWNQTWRRSWPELCTPPLWFVTYDNSKSRNVWAVNYISQRAYEQGADWFLRVNDDTVFSKTNWSSAMVQELQSFRPISGLGVTGPYDAYSQRDLLTHSMVGRLHFQVFGFHFPYTFGNFWSDDWIHQVYVPPYAWDLDMASNTNDTGTLLPSNNNNNAATRMMSILRSIPVKHMGIGGRYTVKGTTHQYKQQLVLDREILHQFVVKHLKKL